MEMVKQEQPDNLRRTAAAYLEVVLELVYVAVRVARGCDAAARLVRVVDQHPSAGVRMTKRDAREIERERICVPSRASAARQNLVKLALNFSLKRNKYDRK